MTEATRDAVDIAIVGGGVSGLYAAYRLVDIDPSRSTIMSGLLRPTGRRPDIRLFEATDRVGGRLLPVPSEAGHSDFAARTDAELALVRAIRAEVGRVDIERVVSGIGLVHIAAHLHGADHCAVAGRFAEREGVARVSQAAAAGSCAHCAAVMDLFVDAYGAEAGNLALRAVATAGVYVGGGIAPKILPLLTRRFMAPFLDKAPMTPLLATMPVQVILDDRAALLGAAVAALDL